jgi:hypothetical protein
LVFGATSFFAPFPTTVNLRRWATEYGPPAVVLVIVPAIYIVDVSVAKAVTRIVFNARRRTLDVQGVVAVDFRISGATARERER